MLHSGDSKVTKILHSGDSKVIEMLHSDELMVTEMLHRADSIVTKRGISHLIYDFADNISFMQASGIFDITQYLVEI